MRRIIVGDCAQERLLQLSDPDAPSEVEFEHAVARALTCVYPQYRCIVFSGGFRLDTDVHRPDLALVARDFSHWFIIEVEFTSHSLDRHVLPQVRAFRYGDPLQECVAVLARSLEIDSRRAETLVRHVPRAVVVAANRRDPTWEIALRSHNIQLVTVTSFRAPNGTDALEIDGDIEVVRESLGFGVYSATDRSLRFPSTVRLPAGSVQIADTFGAVGLWTVMRDQKHAWITKDQGAPAIDNETYVQMIRTIDGRLSLRCPASVARNGPLA